MKVACNASPLIGLSHTGHFTRLQELFEVGFIAPEVRAETVERALDYPNAETVRAGYEAGWMVVVPPTMRTELPFCGHNYMPVKPRR